MDDFLDKSILYLIIGIIFLFFLVRRRRKREKEELIIEKQKPLIEKIRKEYEEEQKGNWLKALEKFPSEHLLGKEKEWEEITDRQREYFIELNDVSAKKIQERYNLSAKDWKNLKSKFFIEDAQQLMRNPKYKEAMEIIKHNKRNSE